MGICYKCAGDMRIEGDNFVCISCGLRRPISRRIPSQSELLGMVQQLTTENEKLKAEIEYYKKSM